MANFIPPANGVSLDNIFLTKIRFQPKTPKFKEKGQLFWGLDLIVKKLCFLIKNNITDSQTFRQTDKFFAPYTGA